MGRINIAKIALMLLIIGLFLFISGCVNSPKENITPTPNTPPKAAASASPSSIYEGDAVSFNGLSSVDSDGSIVSYQWNFGDGETGTGATLSHKYSKAGTYAALLTVVDNGGLKDTDSIKIIVNPKPTPTPIIQTTAKAISSENVIKIIDFIPRKGETIAGLPLSQERILSGEAKNLGIDYIPEDVSVWGNSVGIRAWRFLNSDDTKKFWSYAITDNTTIQQPVSIGEWTGSRGTTTVQDGTDAGTWRWVAIHKEEYILDIEVNGDKTPMSQEKAETIARILTDRYNAALW